MSRLLLGGALGATGAFMLDPKQGPRRRAQVQRIAGSASILYAVLRGGIGAVVPLALGAALLGSTVSGGRRARLHRA